MTTSTSNYYRLEDSSNGHWNVFLSFRGEDTRKNFTGHLYIALKQAGIRTFIDDSGLPRGEKISDNLLKAIRDSDISLVIFSKNYASSTWCLDELVEILECKRRTGHFVYPVFYNISPAVVRHSTGSFAAAFEKHEERYVSNMDKVNTWRAALTKAANLSGFDLRNDADGYEVRLIRIIVEKVLLEVNLVGLNVAKEPVGIESRMDEIMELLGSGSNDIRKIAIYGRGGIGKTTLAKALFNKNFRHFEGSCFLSYVRETSKGQDAKLQFQEQLLSEILIVDKFKVENDHTDINLLMKRLSFKKVLIVIDDLNNRSQFDYLARQWNQFSVGSRILITTRNAGLFEQIDVDMRYSVKKLDRDESLELFSRHAFRKPIPSEDLMELSEDIACQAGGFPLALEVLGSYLYKRSIGEWRSSLNKLQQIPSNEIQKKLLLSYHALGDGNLQHVFLDIACYFIGNDKDRTISILNSCGFDSENEIIILMERCLLSVDDKNELRMHDLVREMGRNIAQNNCRDEPWKHSRLWSSEDIYKVLNMNKGKKCIECIIPYGVSKIYSLQTIVFRKMQKLRLLSINKVHLSGSFRSIFEELRWLSWQDCPLECLPTDFCPKNLVFLHLQRSNFKILWNGPRCLEQLKDLNVSGCTFLTTTPDFSGVPCIEELNLSNCKGLVEVHPSIGQLVGLVNLNLMGCVKLKCLPSSIWNLKALEQLDLDNCLVLEALPDGMDVMKSLRILRAAYTAITTVPESIGCLSKLAMLKLNHCKRLSYLPSTICNLKTLEQLILYGDSYVEVLPYGFGRMESLRMLSVECTAITSLPESIGHLSKLSKLLLHGCKKLVYIPSSICNLRSLERLDLTACSSLEELPKDIGNIISLRAFLTRPGPVAEKFREIPYSVLYLKNLEVLDINWSLVTNVGFSPSSLFALSSLKNLNLSYLYLVDIPDSISCLSSLQHLDLSGNHFSTLTPSLNQLTDLKSLKLTKCKYLCAIQQLPPKLSDLYANFCTSVKTVHVPKLNLLRYLNLAFCSSLVEIAGLDRLKSVIRIDMLGCGNLSITFEESLFQVFSGKWGTVDIILPKR